MRYPRQQPHRQAEPPRPTKADAPKKTEKTPEPTPEQTSENHDTKAAETAKKG